MCNKQGFYDSIENTTKMIDDMKNKNARDILQLVCNAIVAYYPDTQISFAERIGKRVSYIVGAGTELFKPSEMININNRYVLVMQNFDNISSDEKDNIIKLFKKIIL